jgi:hypothetical protein
MNSCCPKLELGCIAPWNPGVNGEEREAEVNWGCSCIWKGLNPAGFVERVGCVKLGVRVVDPRVG